MKVRGCACGLVLLLTAPLGAGERLSLRVSPSVSFAPANLVVRAMVEAHPDNRSMAIVAESDDFYRASQIQLDGDRAARTTMFEFRSLPSGFYEVRAIVFDQRGSPRAQAVSRVQVVESAASR
jgi:hypothetical protein